MTSSWWHGNAFSEGGPGPGDMNTTGNSSHKGLATWSFNIFFAVILNKLLKINRIYSDSRHLTAQLIILFNFDFIFQFDNFTPYVLFRHFIWTIPSIRLFSWQYFMWWFFQFVDFCLFFLIYSLSARSQYCQWRNGWSCLFICPTWMSILFLTLSMLNFSEET